MFIRTDCEKEYRRKVRIQEEDKSADLKGLLGGKGVRKENSRLREIGGGWEKGR